MSSVMGDIQMERYVAQRRELNGLGDEYDSGDYTG